MKVLQIKTQKRIEMLDITREVQSVLAESHIDSGVCVLFVPHTTAAVTINEHADPSVKEDILDVLSRLVPYGKNYRHLEGNSDAHIKSTIVSPSLSLIVENGKIALGTWQGVFFCEFDGPRNRRLYIKVIKQ